ncbi:hypothetical protein AC1031_019919 [Aphanomyces cochlioides]|nr:hypothetical protein AC1031_019919 [Aphanomyces cochlioides]
MEQTLRASNDAVFIPSRGASLVKVSTARADSTRASVVQHNLVMLSSRGSIRHGSSSVQKVQIVDRQDGGYDLTISNAAAIQGLKFAPPKHWIVQERLGVQVTEDAPSCVSDGDCLVAINHVSVVGKQYADVVNGLRSIDRSTVLTFACRPKMLKTIHFYQKTNHVRLSNGASYPLMELIVDILRARDRGLSFSDVLVAVNGRSVVGMTPSKIQAMIQCYQVVTLEWVPSIRGMNDGVTAWGVLQALHCQPLRQSRACNLCSSRFGLFKHKFHCSLCGLVVCIHGSSALLTLPGDAKYRLCLDCANKATTF